MLTQCHVDSIPETRSKKKREQVPVGVGLHELKFKELANGEEEHAGGNGVARLLRQRLALIEGPARHELGHTNTMLTQCHADSIHTSC